MKAGTMIRNFAAAVALLMAGEAGYVAVAHAQSNNQPGTMEELLRRVQEGRVRDAEANRQREAEFRQRQSEQRNLINAAQAEVATLNRRSDEMEATFQKNEIDLTNLQNQLTERLGAFGELFGVVRQIAGDTRGQVEQSLISAQLPGRAAPLGELAQTTDLPEMSELQQLWYTLQQEAVEQGKVVKFNANVTRVDGSEAQETVVRVGPFVAMSGGRFLQYMAATGKLQELPRQPAGDFTSAASSLESAAPGTRVDAPIDPSRGAILGLLIQTATFMERVDQGGLIGYITMILGALGAILAIERIISLTLIGGKVKAQVKDSTPRNDNPLGRVMQAYHENKNVDTETLELKLDEAVVRELPKLERGLSTLKVIAAVAPLLGLLGTVTGMIQTFQVITLFGAGDPKLMAGGISQALVTTVQGLVVAIPILLLHSIASGRSKAIVETLEGQAAGLVAEHAEAEEGKHARTA